MDVFLNGKMLPPDQARIPADDAGFQHAVGLFETMSAQNGRVFRLTQHMDRLCDSAITLGLSRDLNADALAEAVRMTIEHNRIDRARIRLTVTPGSLSLLSGKPTPGSSPGTVLIQPGEPTEFDPRYFEDGITVLIAQPGANPFDAMAGHKTLAYWSRLRTLRQAASVRGAGAGEAIWLNVSNHLASGAISNLFLVKDGQLLTPIARGEESEKGLPAPVLPGITRAAVIELAEGLGVTVKRQMLSIDDLLDADEVFLTNSSWHILPVSRVEKSPIGQGKAGDLTRRLRTDLLKLIERETSE
jgi:branched-subunit amino acid aminotransferase/4-amino-4-deoxychorismate lyase